MDVSLVIPIYGAERFLLRNLSDIDEVLSKAEEKWELILVVDASPDSSGEICREFAAFTRPYPVQVLINETNLGKGGAVRRGMLSASGRYRIFNDCDLAYPMSEVLKILKTLREGKSVAIASRALKDSRYIFSPENFRYLYTRHVASRALNSLIHRMFLPHYQDTQAGLKGFTAETAQFLFSQLKLTGFSFDLELLHLASRSSLSIEEVPVDFYAQRVSTIDFPGEVLRMGRDILRIYYWTIRKKYNFEIPLTSQKELHLPE